AQSPRRGPARRLARHAPADGGAEPIATPERRGSAEPGLPVVEVPGRNARYQGGAPAERQDWTAAGEDDRGPLRSRGGGSSSGDLAGAIAGGPASAGGGGPRAPRGPESRAGA